jgi:hypothetical protein
VAAAVRTLCYGRSRTAMSEEASAPPAS